MVGRSLEYWPDFFLNLGLTFLKPLLTDTSTYSYVKAVYLHVNDNVIFTLFDIFCSYR